MGGGKQLFDYDKLFYDICNDLNKISFFVHFPSESNYALLNIDKTYEEVCNNVSNYFKSHGYRYEDLGPVGEGGGGFESLIEIIKQFITTWSFLEFAISLRCYILAIYHYYGNKNYLNRKPKVFVGFIINTGLNIKKFQKNQINNEIRTRLANLLFIADSIGKRILETNNVFAYNFSITAEINLIHYSVSLDIPNDHQNNSVYLRLINIINNIKIKENLQTEYNFTKWFAICRSDSKIARKNNSYEIESTQKYYLLLSSKILNDYLSVKN